MSAHQRRTTAPQMPQSSASAADLTNIGEPLYSASNYIDGGSQAGICLSTATLLVVNFGCMWPTMSRWVFKMSEYGLRPRSTMSATQNLPFRRVWRTLPTLPSASGYATIFTPHTCNLKSSFISYTSKHACGGLDSPVVVEGGFFIEDEFRVPPAWGVLGCRITLLKVLHITSTSLQTPRSGTHFV